MDNRPLHADEAVQAWQTWRLLDGAGYRYDPLDRHGPWLYFGSAALHRFTGGEAADYDDHAARIFVLLAGVATLALSAWGPRWAAGTTPWVGAFAVALLALETLSSLYHTYFVQEAWLALWVWAFFWVGLRLAGQTEVRARDVFGLGLLAGLAQTNKEITPLYLGLAALAGWAAHGGRWFVPRWSTVGWGVAGFLLPVGLFYSSFGSHPAGVLDAFRTYGLQAARLSESPHTYPWWHYLRTLGVLPTGGPRWGQYLLLALALAGVVESLRPQANRAHRAVAYFTVSLLVVHSVISYKTPWLMLTPVIGIGLLAAQALAWLAARGRWAAVAAVVVAGATVAQCWQVGRLALDRYPGDARNPYFYEQTPRAFMRLPDRIAQLEENLGRPLRIAVFSPEDAWPLPWYLREHATVGYMDDVPVNLGDWDMVVWDTQWGEGPWTGFDDRVVEYVGLRPNGLLEISIASPVWEATFSPLP
ncbi:hypothetical protein PXH66_03900 [Synoicihabitans lomoniglobus]|uniref:Glycosyltransferase RgtA/B/C/D-like domain-containing protein n=1 Tax=Synoicihabitans lomoniglobus TaxID=2909285 RepID=A0AAF0CQ55_9BACT|nr:hypothetical protein PXH66_03900 [Opitutaceae bacterium LMO-M01]